MSLVLTKILINFLLKTLKDLRKFDPGDTGAMDFADYAAIWKGSPGLKYSGNVGNLEKYVTGKDEFGRTMYGYREKLMTTDQTTQSYFLKTRHQVMVTIARR